MTTDQELAERLRIIMAHHSWPELEQAADRLEQRDKDAERYQHLLSLLASAWFYGGWKAETTNERDMQKILVAAGWWPVVDEAWLLARIDAARLPEER